MRAIVITTDPILISYATSLLADAGIEALTFDQNASIVDGSIGALPRRVMVAEESYGEARQILEDAGLGKSLREKRGATS